MALRSFDTVHPNLVPQYQQDRDTWLTDLFLDYIRASESAGGELYENVWDACDQDISTILWIVIELLAKTDR
jgi:hypothetical protein